MISKSVLDVFHCALLVIVIVHVRVNFTGLFTKHVLIRYNGPSVHLLGVLDAIIIAFTHTFDLLQQTVSAR